MDFIAEIFVEVILEFLLVVPGGSLRWVFFKLIGKPKPFKTCIKDNPILNGIIGAISIAIVVTVLIGIFDQ